MAKYSKTGASKSPVSKSKGKKALPTPETASAFEEPVVMYHKKMRVGSNVAEEGIIFGKVKKAEWKMSAQEKMALLRDGVSKEKLEQLKDRTKLDYDKLSVILATTRSTLINKKGKDLFSNTLSERIISVAELYSFGYEVFEDEDRFNAWIFHPNRALGGKMPFDLIDNQFGREEIKNLIGRIAYGVYS